MKLAYFLVLPVMVSSLFVAVTRAEDGGKDKVEIKDKDDGKGNREYRMKVSKRGDHYYGNYNNHEYEMRGDAARFTTDGEYVVHGDIGTDNTYFQTRDYQPYVVEERHDPAIKIRLPGVEIK